MRDGGRGAVKRRIKGEVKAGRGFHLSDADAQLVDRELKKIAEARGGDYTERDVLNVVRPWDKRSRHPLKRFYPNAQDAAMAGWLERTRYLIRAVTFVVEPLEGGRPHPIRAHVHLEEGYTPVLRALSNRDDCAELVERARRELSAWYERYKHIEELATEIEAVEKLL